MNDIPTVDLGPEDEAPPSEDKLDRIVRLARLQISQERAVEEAEELLDRAKAALRRTREADLPEALAVAGTDMYRLAETGEVIEVMNEVFASIPKGKEPEAFAWFEEDKHGDLIKHVITVKLPRGFPKTVARIKQSLIKFNSTLSDSERFELKDEQSIHHQTLQKFVRDAGKVGRDDLPDDLLGIFRRRVTVVTRPEEAKL